MSSDPVQSHLQPGLQRAQSHQSGTITQHWNDLPTGYIPSPSSGNSRSASRNSNTLAAGTSAGRDVSPGPLKGPQADTTDSTASDADVKPLDVLLPTLYNLPTTIPRSEHGTLQTRINKSLLPTKGDGGVQDEQRLWIQQLLHRFVVEGLDQKEAREEIIGFMRRETGVAGWAGSVRKIVESVAAPGA